MNDYLGVLVIHGMGRQRPNYSAGLRDEITSRLDDHAPRVDWQEIYWADALEDREAQLQQCMQGARGPDGRRLPLDFESVREFVIHNFGDALAYYRDSADASSAYHAIHVIVTEAIERLQDRIGTAAPVVVLAHSLGAHIMSCYLWDRQQPRAKRERRQRWQVSPSRKRYASLDTLVSMITFGCNIPLFSLAFPVAKPIRLPGSAIRQPGLRARARWLNYYDRDDVLGYPLRALYQKNWDALDAGQRATVERIEDYQINVGMPVLDLTPKTHTEYWTDNDLTRPVAEHIRSLIMAME